MVQQRNLSEMTPSVDRPIGLPKAPSANRAYLDKQLGSALPLAGAFKPG